MINEKTDPDRVRGGYKAMASSIGMTDGWQKVKRYMQSKSFKDKIVDAKKKAKEASDPEAYLASVERKIISGHFGKSEGLEGLLNSLKLELGELTEQDKRRVPSKHPGKKISKKKKSEIVKRAKKREDIGKPGKKFKEIEAKAAKKYGSEESGKRIAASAMWKAAKKKGYK